MQYLKLFHRDVLTVRSHQWKYYVEPYSGCALQCTYCLYWQTPSFVERLYPPLGLLPGLERELGKLSRRQIVYIGSTIDPYQMLEKKVRATRHILELLAERELPVVILTKSPLILRDLGLLTDLSRRGLVLVQFTVLTTSPEKARVLERGAPSVADRLRAAAQLSAAGIPVHVHLSPLIPGLYANGELNATVRAIADTGVECIYSNILGMRHLNTEVWLDSVEKLGLGGLAAWSRTGDPGKNVFSPDIDLIHDQMSWLGEVCQDNAIDFICEFIPGLDAFDPVRFENGIFRFGLPAVYQMARLFQTRGEHQHWPGFRDALRSQFQAVDDEYLALVRELWDSGELFENTTIASEMIDGQRNYYRTEHLQLARDSVLAWD